MTILSREPLTDLERRQVEDILRESQCPHESLRETFPRYSGMLGSIITFDGVSLKDFLVRQPIKKDI